MQAIILAAGSGSRIETRTRGRPKCLLEVGGLPLIEHQINSLRAAGVDSIVVVVGFEHEQIRRVVGGAARFVVNERYAETNSLYSFWLAREAVTDDALVLNSDVLLDPAIVHAMVRTSGNALAFDSLSGDDPEHMKVALQGECLVEMSKSLSANETCGENLGLIRLSRRACRDAFEIAGRMVSEGRHGEWLASAINVTARRHPFRAIDVAGLSWIEIDFLEDLERARRETWPAIAATVRAQVLAGAAGPGVQPAAIQAWRSARSRTEPAALRSGHLAAAQLS